MVTERTTAAVERTRSTLSATPAIRRPYGFIAASLITALLMLASFFTISSILASADLAPTEALLLPIAFGPVFVITTKTAVAAWLSSAAPDRMPPPGQRVISWIIGPALACASVALVSGVALKSVAVGAQTPLRDGVSQISSMLMFAGLALGELAGAAALAVRQHRPGARAFAAARNQHRWASLIHEFAHARLRVAEGHVDAAERALAARQEWKTGRAQAAVASGWRRAARDSRAGDGFRELVNIGPVSIPRP
jgi:hypothetical protein